MGGKGVLRRRWSEDKIKRFIKDFNEGLGIAALREKYDTSDPLERAYFLRKKGHGVKYRAVLRRVTNGS